MERIVIVGAGVVGFATGKGFIDAGHDVAFVDVDPLRVDELQRDGYTASHLVELDQRETVIFLVVPTPNVGNAWELGAIKSATRSVGRAIAAADGGSKTVVVRSTVPPGTAEGIVQSILEVETGREVGDGYQLASNPEFLRAASALDDFLNPWMTVIGTPDEQTRANLRELYRPFGGELRAFASFRTTELIKCAHNLYNATKISFWNEMWRVADLLAIDCDEVAETVALSAEGSFNVDYGIRGGAPYGGACLPKDTRGFLGFAAVNGLSLPLLTATIQVNEMLGEPHPNPALLPEITAASLHEPIAA